MFLYLEDRERILETATDKLLMSVTAFASDFEREKARQLTHDARSPTGQLRKIRVSSALADVMTPRLAKVGGESRPHCSRRPPEIKLGIFLVCAASESPGDPTRCAWAPMCVQDFPSLGERIARRPHLSDRVSLLRSELLLRIGRNRLRAQCDRRVGDTSIVLLSVNDFALYESATSSISTSPPCHFGT